MIRAAILGGNGFLGRSLAAELQKAGVAVTSFDLAPGPYSAQVLNILDREKVLDAFHGMDWVFNFAGLLGTSELNDRAFDAAQVNIIGMINALDACINCRVSRMIYPSKPPIWKNIYTATKLSADHIVGVYKLRGFDARGIIVRNAYGPGQLGTNIRKAVPDMISRALNEGAIEIFGSGNQPIDLIHEADLASLFSEVARVGLNSWPYTFPIETGLTQRVSACELARLICAALPEVEVRLVHVPMREGEEENLPLPEPAGPFAASVANFHPPKRDLADEISEIVVEARLHSKALIKHSVAK